MSLDPPQNYRLRLLSAGVCNLHCDYCHVFGHGQGVKSSAQMSESTAKSIIDAYVDEIGERSDSELELGFYGGEPLTNWRLIATAIEHAGRRFDADRVSYVLNTNATLARREYVGICKDANIDVHVGLDGADDLANARRRTRTGKSTFSRAIAGIEAFAAAGCRIQINTCLTEANLDSLVPLVDLARDRQVDRIYAALPDGRPSSRLRERSAAEIARTLLRARAYGRTKGVDVGGPWARAIFASASNDLIPQQPTADGGGTAAPYLVFNAAGQAHLMPYPDAPLGDIGRHGLHDMLHSSTCRRLYGDWKGRVSACATCSLVTSCKGYLRGLVMYHQGNDAGFARECQLALSVLDALPTAYGGDLAFSAGARLALSRQLRTRKAGNRRILTQQMTGCGLAVSDDDLTFLRQFDRSASPAEILERFAVPALGPVLAQHLERKFLLPENLDEEQDWLLSQVGGDVSKVDAPRFRIFSRPGQVGLADNLAKRLESSFRSLDESLISPPARPVLVYLAATDSDFAVLWGESAMPSWVNVFVKARRVIVVRAPALEINGEAQFLAQTALSHEIAHVYLGETRCQIPIWLEEGVCEYLAKGKYQPRNAAPKGRLDTIGFRAIESIGIGTLLELDASPPAENAYYRQSWSFVSFLVDQYGSAVFRRFLDGTFGRDDYRSVFADTYGLDVDRIEQAWLPGSEFNRTTLCVTASLGVIEKAGRCLVYNTRHGDAVRMHARVAQPLQRRQRDGTGIRSISDFDLTQMPADLVARLYAGRILLHRGDDPAPEGKAANAFSAAGMPDHVSSLRLNVTDRCNMRCTYCYVDHDGGTTKHMDEATALGSLEQFLNLAERTGQRAVTVRFFGGEPLLNWPLVEKSLTFIAHRKAVVEVRKILNTNSLHVRRDVARVLAERQVEVVASIDGVGAVHDLNRRLKNGKGTFERVSSGIETLLAAGCRVAIAVTVTESNIRQLHAIVDWVAELQQRFDAAIPVGLNGLSMMDMASTGAPAADEMAACIVDAVRYGEERLVDLSSSKLLHSWNAMLGRAKRGRYCPAIGDEISVDPRGRISPCAALPLILGHADSLSDALSSEPFKSLATRVSGSIPACRGCAVEAYCAGGCAADAYSRAGSAWANDRACELRRALFAKMVDEFALRSETPYFDVNTMSKPSGLDDQAGPVHMKGV